MFVRILEIDVYRNPADKMLMIRSSKGSSNVAGRVYDKNITKIRFNIDKDVTFDKCKAYFRLDRVDKDPIDVTKNEDSGKYEINIPSDLLSGNSLEIQLEIITLGELLEEVLSVERSNIYDFRIFSSI